MVELFVLQVKTETTGFDNVVLTDDVYGVYSSYEKAEEVIYELAGDAPTIERDLNLYCWFFEEEGQEFYAEAAITIFEVEI